MKIFAFVFARGGSKGLPGKNLLALGGIPLIGHSINIAKETPTISKVFVSTDADDIAEAAKSFGAVVIRRPAELADDTASEWLAWKHAIEYLRDSGETFDLFVSLPATSPLRSRQDVESCINACSSEVDVVVTVTPASRSPYFNMLIRNTDGISRLVCDAGPIYRRQDAPAVYDMTTVAYVLRPNFILEKEGLFSGVVRSVIIPKQRAIDIDDVYDFKMAELLFGSGGVNA